MRSGFGEEAHLDGAGGLEVLFDAVEGAAGFGFGECGDDMAADLPGDGGGDDSRGEEKHGVHHVRFMRVNVGIVIVGGDPESEKNRAGIFEGADNTCEDAECGAEPEGGENDEEAIHDEGAGGEREVGAEQGFVGGLSKNGECGDGTFDEGIERPDPGVDVAAISLGSDGDP